MNIGPTVRRLRKERGLSQKDFAKLCKLAPGTLFGVEVRQNNCSLVTLSLMAAGFGMKASELVALAEEQAEYARLNP